MTKQIKKVIPVLMLLLLLVGVSILSKINISSGIRDIINLVFILLAVIAVIFMWIKRDYSILSKVLSTIYIALIILEYFVNRVFLDNLMSGSVISSLLSVSLIISLAKIIVLIWDIVETLDTKIFSKNSVENDIDVSSESKKTIK